MFINGYVVNFDKDINSYVVGGNKLTVVKFFESIDEVIKFANGKI